MAALREFCVAVAFGFAPTAFAAAGFGADVFFTAAVFFEFCLGAAAFAAFGAGFAPGVAALFFTVPTVPFPEAVLPALVVLFFAVTAFCFTAVLLGTDFFAEVFAEADFFAGDLAAVFLGAGFAACFLAAGFFGAAFFGAAFGAAFFFGEDFAAAFATPLAADFLAGAFFAVAVAAVFLAAGEAFFAVAFFFFPVAILNSSLNICCSLQRLVADCPRRISTRQYPQARALVTMAGPGRIIGSERGFSSEPHTDPTGAAGREDRAVSCDGAACPGPGAGSRGKGCDSPGSGRT